MITHPEIKSIFLFQFQFVNSFLALFYIAFYLQDMDKLKDVSMIVFQSGKICIRRFLLI